MSLIEAILFGVQLKRLQKPIVFAVMLISFIFFTGLGVLMIAAGVESLNEGKRIIPSLGLASFSIIFFGISFLCGHFIKKCIK